MFIEEKKIYTLVVDPACKKIFKTIKSRKPSLFRDLKKQTLKIVKETSLGKPLRNVLKNRRRVHIGSFVLIYEIYGNEIRLLDFDHHDRIYKKYR